MCVVQQGRGQEKINLASGFGLPELIHAGVRYQLNQAQIGFSYGAFSNREGEKLRSYTLETFIHIAGKSAFSQRKPAYLRLGLNRFTEDDSYTTDKYLYLVTRIGRDFNFSKVFGIQMDVGAAFELSHHEIQKVPNNSWFDLDMEFPVLPALSVGIFARL